MFAIPRLGIPLIDRFLAILGYMLFRPKEISSMDAAPEMTTSSSDSQLTNAALRCGLDTAFSDIYQLRNDLRKEDTIQFWTKLVIGISKACKAQYAFLSAPTNSVDTKMRPAGIGFDARRRTTDDTALTECDRLSFEVPHVLPIDEHELIAEGLPAVLGEERMAELPFPLHSYLCVPMPVSRTKVVSLGLLWTQQGIAELDLSWTAIRLLVLALEDLVKSRARLLGLNKPPLSRIATPRKDHHVRRDSGNRRRPATPRRDHRPKHPSFRTFAPHLSHELRTPMQGVVGIFDIIQADIDDISRDNRGDVADRLKVVSQLLEDAHDSARRAVQAADNIIIAYELDMHVPSTPYSSDDDSHSEPSSDTPSGLSLRNVQSIDEPMRRPWTARKRHAGRKRSAALTSDVRMVVEDTKNFIQAPTPHAQRAIIEAMSSDSSESSLIGVTSRRTSAIPSTRIREVIHLVIGESLHVGGRPEQVLVEPTEEGERFVVRCRSSDGRVTLRTIEWSASNSVPEELFVREKDLVKLVSCIFLNALKFTESGSITVRVVPDERRAGVVLIRVRDSGSGIPAAFLPRLFEPFARENQSITRTNEGLGLGLLVAKGLSRRIGGDLACLWSSTAPHNHGTEFEISVPVGGKAASVLGDLAESNRLGLAQPRRSSSMTGLETASGAPPARPDASFLARNSTQALQHLTPRLSTTPLVATPPASERPATPSLPPPSSNLRLTTKDFAEVKIDRQLGEKYPLNCLVAEDNKIVREILVKLLRRLGYQHVYEAFDGRDAVEKMAHSICTTTGKPLATTVPSDAQIPIVLEPDAPRIFPSVPIDVIFMDIWLPRLDGLSATREILNLVKQARLQSAQANPGGWLPPLPAVLFTTADLSEDLHKEVDNLGSRLLLKPHGLQALQRAILDLMSSRDSATTPSTGSRDGACSFLGGDEPTLRTSAAPHGAVSQ